MCSRVLRTEVYGVVSYFAVLGNVAFFGVVHLLRLVGVDGVPEFGVDRDQFRAFCFSRFGHAGERGGA